MRFRGVGCQDCHNPHSMKTLLPGNWLCLRCHDGSYPNAPAINPVEHSHHKVFGFDAAGKPFNTDLTTYRPSDIRETGGECVNCHMPQKVYMQRHRRHDHGFTIPDPLLTKEFGIPNACNRCHLDKTIDWTLEAAEKWYGKKMERPSRFRTEWIARARNHDSAAREPLLDLLATEASPYWRAVAVGLLEHWVGDSQVNAGLIKALDDAHPLVREQAVSALEALPEVAGSDIETKLRSALQDSSRNVRISAAWALRGDVPSGSPALRELEQYLDLNADQPAGQLQKAVYALAKNQLQTALAHFQKAAEWDPNSAPIRDELAIVLSRLGRNREAIDQLEAACRLEPNEAEHRFKLGLAWNELGALDRTIASLEKAVELDPRHARAWYNLGLARDSRGEIEGALEALSRGESVAPEDPRIAFAHATILLRLNRVQDAKVLLKRCLEIKPDFTDARTLLQQISETSGR
jgi:tetratricopeptide (TPR) repeat protein